MKKNLVNLITVLLIAGIWFEDIFFFGDMKPRSFLSLHSMLIPSEFVHNCMIMSAAIATVLVVLFSFFIKAELRLKEKND